MTIGGSGLRIGGPTVVWGHGRLRTQTASRFKPADFPQFGIPQGTIDSLNALGCTGLVAQTHTGSSRTLVTPCITGTPFPRYAGTSDLGSAGMRMTASRVAFKGFAALTIRVFPATLNVPLRVHDGATLASVTLYFKIGFDHLLAGVAPRARVLRVDQGGTRTPITLNATGADTNGFVTYALPTAAASWYDAGKVKSLTLAIDTSPAIIDLSLYSYVLEVIEEDNGAAFPSQISYRSPVVVASTADVALLGSPTLIDGVNVAAGKRVLLKDQTDPSQNGIWLTSAADWSRANDMNNAEGLAVGAAVLVQSGPLNGGKIFQMVSGGFVDTVVVNAASTANIVLNAPQMVDTIPLIAGNLCLVKDNTVPTENGIYTVQAGAWTRLTSVAPQYVVPASGSANGHTVWLLAGNTATITTLPAVNWVQGVVPYGNVWLGAACSFNAIASMRFQ